MLLEIQSNVHKFKHYGWCTDLAKNGETIVVPESFGLSEPHGLEGTKQWLMLAHVATDLVRG